MQKHSDRSLWIALSRWTKYGSVVVSFNLTELYFYTFIVNQIRRQKQNTNFYRKSQIHGRRNELLNEREVVDSSIACSTTSLDNYKFQISEYVFICFLILLQRSLNYIIFPNLQLIQWCESIPLEQIPKQW